MKEILLVLSAGALGTVSVVVGGWLERRSSIDSWVRQERMKAYAMVLEAGQQFSMRHALAQGFAEAEVGDKMQADYSLSIHETTIGLLHAEGLVRLLGPNDVAKLARTYVIAIGDQAAKSDVPEPEKSVRRAPRGVHRGGAGSRR